MSVHRLIITFSTKARADFEDILIYTERRWGAEQADAYGDILRAALLTLSEFPDLGRQREELGRDLRSYPVGQHVIYYRARGKNLIIRRIAHARRDIFHGRGAPS